MQRLRIDIALYAAGVANADPVALVLDRARHLTIDDEFFGADDTALDAGLGADDGGSHTATTRLIRTRGSLWLCRRRYRTVGRDTGGLVLAEHGIGSGSHEDNRTLADIAWPISDQSEG